MQVSQGVQASSESQQAHVDYLQKSLQGLNSGMSEYNEATALAFQGTTATAEAMCSKVCPSMSALHNWYFFTKSDFSLQHECLVRQEQQTTDDMRDNVAQGLSTMNDVRSSEHLEFRENCDWYNFYRWLESMSLLP